MYTNLILYRNELKNRNIPKYKIVGIVTELLLSKIIFKKNQDISKFIKEVFNIEFKNYIIKSRTMIVARVSKIIIESDNNFEYKNKLNNFINLQIDILKENKQEKNNFSGWIKV